MTAAVLEYLFALAAGFGVGLFYFLGLRLTLRLARTLTRPVRLNLASFLIRTATAAALFVWIGAGRPHRFALAIAGFILARSLVILLCTTRDESMTAADPEEPPINS